MLEMKGGVVERKVTQNHVYTAELSVYYLFSFPFFLTNTFKGFMIKIFKKCI